jgi:hypothetical protein
MFIIPPSLSNDPSRPKSQKKLNAYRQIQIRAQKPNRLSPNRKQSFTASKQEETNVSHSGGAKVGAPSD